MVGDCRLFPREHAYHADVRTLPTEEVDGEDVPDIWDRRMGSPEMGWWAFGYADAPPPLWSEVPGMPVNLLRPDDSEATVPRLIRVGSRNFNGPYRSNLGPTALPYLYKGVAQSLQQTIPVPVGVITPFPLLFPPPISADQARIQQDPLRYGDRHMFVLDARGPAASSDPCVSWEFAEAARPDELDWFGETFWAETGSRWPLGGPDAFDGLVDSSGGASPANRFAGADAAALPMAPAIIRTDELADGVVDHATLLVLPSNLIRRASSGDSGAQWPAFTSDGGNIIEEGEADDAGAAPRMGSWIRLRDGYPLTGDPQVDAVLNGLKVHGAILHDSGQENSWGLAFEPDTKWDFEDVSRLRQVKLSEFEMIDPTPMRAGAMTAAGTIPTVTQANDWFKVRNGP